MTAASHPRFAVDLFAYWNAQAWGIDDLGTLVQLGVTDPRALWDRLLDMLVRSGVDAFEVTFAPFDWRTLVRAYGDVPGVLSALDAHGLSICGGYLPHLEVDGALTEAGRAGLLTEATAAAEFLAAVGGTSLIGSLPHRATRGSSPDGWVDLATAQLLSEPLHEIGRAAYAAGISFGLHTESHSQMWLERDVDLFMLATDPFYVGLCPDAAHIALGGGDPIALVTRHRSRLVQAHWKDAVAPISWDLEIDAAVHGEHQKLCRVPGGGIVDWPAWIQVMRAAGLTEPVLLEVDAVATPIDDIRAGIAYLTPLLA